MRVNNGNRTVLKLFRSDWLRILSHCTNSNEWVSTRQSHDLPISIARLTFKKVPNKLVVIFIRISDLETVRMQERSIRSLWVRVIGGKQKRSVINKRFALLWTAAWCSRLVKRCQFEKLFFHIFQSYWAPELTSWPTPRRGKISRRRTVLSIWIERVRAMAISGH